MCPSLAAGIRLANPEDAAALTELMHHLGYEITAAMLTEKLRRFEQSQSSKAFVAVEDQSLIGCISVHTFELFHVHGRMGRITSLVVRSDHRRVGVGSALMEAAEQFFNASGCVKAEVTSGDGRADAHRFYLASGFVQDERRFIKNYAAKTPGTLA